ncbi:ThiF family adenylyltransferase [Agromyces sp. MMS24-K17]|uniref:ThiF family adenylyltransferase n=1 Tax=Agromyces sp. MMS24-K17 TaxID=3372850 RepID=UPI003754062F
MTPPPVLRLHRDDAAASPERAVRFSRLAVLPGFGRDGVDRLARASVLVVGAGGLGCPALLGLAANGVGRIGIVDDDVVEPSNLARQLLHAPDRIGVPKAASAAAALRERDPDLEVVEIVERLTAENAAALLGGWDLVVDTVDDFGTHYAVADAAAALGIPHVWGSVLGFDAMASVFWAGHGPTLRDLFPDESAAAPDSCAISGVLSSACAELGALLAGEAAKLVVGVGEPLIGRVAVQDALTGRRREIPVLAGTTGVAPRSDASGRADATGPTDRTGLTDATGPGPAPSRPSAPATPPAALVPTVDPAALAGLLAAGTVVLVDVRSAEERSLGEIAPERTVELDDLLAGAPPARAALRDAELVVVVCAAGIRSVPAARRLLEAGIPAASLAGGTRAWAAAGLATTA